MRVVTFGDEGDHLVDEGLLADVLGDVFDLKPGLVEDPADFAAVVVLKQRVDLAEVVDVHGFDPGDIQ